MSGEEKFWLSCVVTIVTGIVLISTICNYEQNIHYEDMVKSGYQQVTAPGHADLVWQKVK